MPLLYARGIHVLVVDDHDDGRYIRELALEYCAAPVTAAKSARQALEFPATVRDAVVKRPRRLVQAIAAGPDA